MAQGLVLFSPTVISSPKADAPVVAPDFHPDQLGIPYYTIDTTNCYQDSAGTQKVTTPGQTIRRINSRGMTGLDFIADPSGTVMTYTAASGTLPPGAFANPQSPPTTPTLEVFTNNPVVRDFVAGQQRVGILSHSSLNMGLKTATEVIYSQNRSVVFDGTLSIFDELIYKPNNGVTTSVKYSVNIAEPGLSLTPALYTEVDFVAKRRSITAEGKIELDEKYTDNTSGPSLDNPSNQRLGWYHPEQAALTVYGFALSNRVLTPYEKINLTNWFKNRRA